MGNIRSKSVQYAFSGSWDTVSGSGGSLTAPSGRTFQNLVVYIPETGSRTFTSVFTDVYLRDKGSAATSPTGWRIQASVNANPTPTVATLDTTGEGAAISSTITNSGEHGNYVFSRDLTSLFKTNFTGSMLSASVLLVVSCSAQNTNMASAKLYITYEYDDDANIGIKTVRLPLQSSTGSLAANSFLSPGQYMQIPALDSYLPEQGKTYRDIWFEILGNGQENGIVDHYFSMRLDTDASASNQTGPGSAVGNASTIPGTLNTAFAATGQQTENALQSSTFQRIIWKGSGSNTPTWLNTARPHDFQTTVSSLTGATYDCIGTILNVTYEYNRKTTTQVMNSVILIVADDSGYMGGETNVLRSRFGRTYSVQEPGPITLKQSGVQHFFIDSAQVSILPNFNGQQSAFTFAFPARVTCGGWSFINRIDSASVQGNGWPTFGRGNNSFFTDWYRTGTAAGQLGSQYSSVMYLNYTSTVSSQSGGDANHTQTRFQHIWSTGQPFLQITTPSMSLSMSAYDEGDYWLSGYGFWLWSFALGTTQGTQPISLNAWARPEEAAGAGWKNLYSSFSNTDSELGVMPTVMRARDNFKRYWCDPQADPTVSDALDPNKPRALRLQGFSNLVTPSFYAGGHALFTYHTLQSAISGTITGYQGDGSNIYVDIFESGSDVYIHSGSTSVGGNFTSSYWSDTTRLFATARENSSYLGRSDYFTASFLG